MHNIFVSILEKCEPEARVGDGILIRKLYEVQIQSPEKPTLETNSCLHFYPPFIDWLNEV